ncbi:outer membrane autotransporter protein [Pantoea alhagi]|uniref:autotransporter outer membrane beta-barrel domain-containing protein n=1 Tax=Mixta sp. BE291 TaxID=3158787 RepID=UPI00285AFC40|nr:outer membrane autotransporter protein [Pantoea alhagi]
MQKRTRKKLIAIQIALALMPGSMQAAKIAIKQDDTSDKLDASLKANGSLDLQFTNDSYHSDSLYFIDTGDRAKTGLTNDTSLSKFRTGHPMDTIAIHSSGEKTLNNRQLVADGNIDANDKGKINLALTNSSSLPGAIKQTASGGVNLCLKGGNSHWRISDNSHLNKLTLKSSSVEFLTGAFKTLTIAGNYHAEDGKIILNSDLAGDSATSDRIIVQGNTSGDTRLTINKTSGQPAETENGVLLVEVRGTSNGVFRQNGRTTAGLYDYFLRRKDKNWYLVSWYEPAPSVPDDSNNNNRGSDNSNSSNDNSNSGSGSGSNDNSNRGSGNGSDSSSYGNSGGSNTGGVSGNSNHDMPRTHAYRPESASYIANLAVANNLFVTSMHDRQPGQHVEPGTSSFWVRKGGGHAHFTDASGQLKTKSNSYRLQAGSDIVRRENGRDGIRLGVMAGYGNNYNKTQSALTNYHAKAELNGYSMGFYGSWFSDKNRQQGAWLDSWLLYSGFEAYVTGQGLPSKKYWLKGFSGSLEAGYIQPVIQSQSVNFWVEPHAQAVFMGVKDKAMHEIDGTRVKGTGAGNTMTRIGVRSWATGATLPLQKATFRPWLEANWVHNSHAFGVNMNNGSNQQAGAKEKLEIKLGIEGQPIADLHLSGEVSQQRGASGYLETFGTLQIKYTF